MPANGTAGLPRELHKNVHLVPHAALKVLLRNSRGLSSSMRLLSLKCVYIPMKGNLGRGRRGTVGVELRNHVLIDCP